MDKGYFEPELLFRYSDVKITKISTVGKASTVTFLVKDRFLDKVNEQWCFFDVERHNKILRECIVSDVKMNLLVGRYVYKKGTKIKATKSCLTTIEDRLLDAWKVK